MEQAGSGLAERRESMARRAGIAISVAACALILAGCGSVSKWWPWSKDEAPPPKPVDELKIDTRGGGTILQYWEGNTLVLDMTGVAALGAASATPAYDRGWPYRISARTLPGRFGELQVRGAQRAVLPLTTEGTTAVELKIPPGVYPHGQASIELSWGPSTAPAVTFPAPAPVPAPGTAAPAAQPSPGS